MADDDDDMDSLAAPSAEGQASSFLAAVAVKSDHYRVCGKKCQAKTGRTTKMTIVTSTTQILVEAVKEDLVAATETENVPFVSMNFAN
jgi:regulator of extracellular matrix RemA (YlzA/DUF370 family)